MADTETTAKIDGRTIRRSARLVLLVIRSDGTAETHPLPESGAVTIGRSPESRVHIDEPSISRRHAVLHIGPQLRVEDLGSANGTRVRDARLDAPGGAGPGENGLQDGLLRPGSPVDLSPGDVIHLGTITAFVQYGAPAARPRRLWPHGYFEGCLEKECARSERSGTSFAVLRVQIDGKLSPEQIEEVLAGHTRSVDTVAAYGPSQYELLLVDADAGKADEVRSRLVMAFGNTGAHVRVGVACYPADGRNPEALVARAGARARGLERPEGRGSVVVEDPAMLRLYRMAQRVADSSISVLLLGETGAGKEVLAEAIHAASPRGSKAFLRLNCAAFSEQLLESELFGYEKGAFTGAVHAKPGLLETASGGTVFLDEVGELPMATQVKLLRVLEERSVLHIGGLKPRPIDVRFVAATNRDLEHEIERGTFRQDLYFRLNGISLVIPPLRERTGEILPFARAFVGELCRKAERHPIPDISDEASQMLLAYSWPGNIRELRNVMERAVLLCGDGPITREHLPAEKMGDRLMAPRPLPSFPLPSPTPFASADGAPPSSHTRSTYVPPAEVPPPRPTEPLPGDGEAGETLLSTAEMKRRLSEAERARVLAALERCAGNQTQAAKLLGISRRTLVTRLEEYGVPRPRKAVPPRG